MVVVYCASLSPQSSGVDLELGSLCDSSRSVPKPFRAVQGHHMAHPAHASTSTPIYPNSSTLVFQPSYTNQKARILWAVSDVVSSIVRFSASLLFY
ncbi:hypothetical protein P154DRAFT_519536 [Amniculicola lignicola CBS 123094]|uniref:Uncharacterized protein n=1 Tax=Amniculicola lignicola CBS 123094 TaxID=1392246 RepID=A0A6A5WR53_9PLEO|nr:hypothetical protein P154DRAFT_519536 [Amniculicola lignicola CBS 123094]